MFVWKCEIIFFHPKVIRSEYQATALSDSNLELRAAPLLL